MELIQPVFQEATEMGIKMPDARIHTSLDLMRHAGLAPIVYPLPLWPIHPRLRQALLALDLVYLCVSRRDVWREAFGVYGISMKESESGWELQRSGTTASMGRVEAAKLRFGIAFSGISPSEVARQLHERLPD